MAQQVLELPKFSKVFQVDCGASRIILGSTWSKVGRPIVFIRKNLNEANKKKKIMIKSSMILCKP